MLLLECKECTVFDYENCENEDCECGYVKADADKTVCVNVYKVTRRYGGAEEGGWYYNHFTCLETYPVRNKNSDTIKEMLLEEYKDEAHGNIYSVLGGAEIDVKIEMKPSESETTERPFYE